MKLELDKRRWISRQPALLQVLVFFFVFFLSSLVGQLVADLLFGDPVFYKAPARELGPFFFKNALFSLVWAIAFIYFIRRQRRVKKNVS